MDDRMLHGIVGGALGCLLGGFGILILIVAYRTHDLADWGRLAIVGGLCVVLSAALAAVTITRLMGESSRQL
jgi:hypothetical protein